jgi:hypothetical protein
MEILELIGYLDEQIKEVESTWQPGDETGSNLSYEIVDDNTVTIDYDWASYEESDNSTVNILFGANIEVSKFNSGYSVYGGEYESEETVIVNNITELISWLKEEGI